MLAALAAYGIFALAQWPGFHLRALHVVGNERFVTEREIITRAAIDRHANVWLLDANAISRRIERLPYIGRAAIHRRVPADMTIEVTERVPEGCVDDGDDAPVTVDRDRRILEAGCAHAPPRRYHVRQLTDDAPGAFLQLAELGRMQSDAETLAGDGAPYVHFALDRFGGLEATRDDGIVVRFGDNGDVGAKARLVEPILSTLGPKARTIRAIDLRAPGTPVIEFRTVSGLTHNR